MPIYNIETVEEVRDGITNLIDTYEAELPLPYKLAPDWDNYKLLEENKSLVIVTVRDNKELLGYFVLLLSPNLNSVGEKVAMGTTLYLRKEYRKGLLGVRLIKKGEEVAKQYGADCVMIASQTIQPVDTLLGLLKYQPCETLFAKRL